MTLRRLILVTVSAALLFMHPADVLAASGWVLLTPPMEMTREPEIGVKIDHKRPYSEWRQSGAYDTAQDCEYVKSIIQNKSKVLERFERQLEREKQESEYRHKRFWAIMEKKRENWDDKDLAETKEYFRWKERSERRRDGWYDNVEDADIQALLMARCVPSDVVYPSQPKK